MTAGDRTARTVETDDDLRSYLAGVRTAFLAERVVSDDAVAFARRTFELDRTWAAFDGEEQCGTTRTFPSSLRLPGLGAVGVSCLTQVTVLPTHTRRGHLTRLMRAQLEAAAEAGEAASLLVAAEWPIYGRFGYGPATRWSEWQLDSRAAVVVPPPVGRCSLVDAATYDAAAAGVLSRHQAATPGSITRPEWLRRRGSHVEVLPDHDPDKSRCWVLHHDDGGRVDGFATYTTKEKWQGMRPDGIVAVDEVLGVDAVAQRELLRYLAGIDLATKVTWPGRPDDGLRHALYDGRAARQVGTWDFLWTRLLDVPACLTARSYLSTGSVVVEVADPFLRRGGRFAFDVSPEGTSCDPTGAPAEVTVAIGALGAAWLGETDLMALAAAGGIEEHADGAVGRLATLLRHPVVPWCATDF